MSKLFYILLFLVLIATNLVSSTVYHADTIENVQNHKHHQLSKSSLVHCGHRYCYSTDILYRKMMGLYCWNKTKVITHYTSSSRTCSPTVFNVPITATVRKKYRPTPIFQRKKLKHHTTTHSHKIHTPSRPIWRATSTSSSTSTSTSRTAANSGTPTIFSISQKLINEDQQQQLKNLDDFFIVQEENNEIDRDNLNQNDAANGMQFDNDTTDSDIQEEQPLQNVTDETAQDAGSEDEDAVEDIATNNDGDVGENTQVEEQEEVEEEDDNEEPPTTTNMIDTTLPPAAPDEDQDEEEEEDVPIIPIISAGMLPIIPSAITPESPQDPNGGSILTHEMAVNNNVPNKALGIGLGVGVGCIAALGLVGLLFHSKKKKQQDDEQQPSGKQYTRWRPQSFMGVVASVVSKLPRSPSQRSKASSSGRAIDSSTSAPSLTPVDGR